MPATRLLPETVLDTLKKSRGVYQAARGVRMSIGSLIGARHIPGISGRVHFNDFMLNSTQPRHVAQYTELAEIVVEQLEAALAAAGKTWSDIQSVLEFGCGYGRITRALLKKVEPSKVAVCDVIAEGSAFCAREFHVKVVDATPEIADFNAAPSDLVFFISVQTHQSPRRLEALQRQMFALLTPGGVCFFTTMGRRSANTAERYGARWAAEKSDIVRDLGARGLVFHPYGYYNDPEYGMTWETYEHATALLQRLHGDRLRLLYFEEAAQDNHQDIYVYQRAA